ncbi:MAG: GNAT family N-acetyltransferase [Bacteroidetes bacterium]|nr:GNAT family N-acetyltransferase [Bacteroidota bacterium]
MEKIVWKHKKWKKLKKNDLHEILSLRSKVFVVEQNCVYQDIDNKDPQAIHLYGKLNNKIISYSRIFKEGVYYKETSFGRALVSKSKRGQGVGEELVKKSLEIITKNWPNKKVKISAQAHLKAFYKKHGFIEKGKEYLEDGIPHVSMERFC